MPSTARKLSRSRDKAAAQKGDGRHPAVKRIQSLIDESKWKQAWAELHPLLKREPQNASLHWIAGLLQSELGDADKARTHLRFASQQITDDASLFRKLGEVESKLGDEAAANKAYQQALGLENGIPQLLALAEQYRKTGDRTREIEVLEKAHSITPGEGQIALRLAHLHQASFDPTPALGWATAAVKLKPDNWDAYLLLATVLQRLDRLNEALEVYHSLLLVWPKDPRVNRNLGMLCLKLGMNAESVKYLKRAAETAPNRLELECDIVHQQLHA
ncbi:MAG: tetratricopeptide repeat protein, partial [Myxococcota bacterium]|nr:tetratricopeptide repeat protein [Myxococcota bacterium]